MGEILLAFTIITLTFIVIYFKKEKIFKKQSSGIDKTNNVILNTPVNHNKNQKTNNKDSFIFNGTSNHQNNQYSEINSPFIASNSNFLKIKNINYNNINQVSPNNNYSYLKNNCFCSFERTPSKYIHNNSFNLDNKISDEEKDSIEMKIKRINLIDSNLFSNPKDVSKDEYSPSKCEIYESERFKGNKIHNSEKKLKINNTLFTEIDFEIYREAFNTEKKNISVNSLSRNISYYGVKKNHVKDSRLENTFYQDNEDANDLNNISPQHESLKFSYNYHTKHKTNFDSQVKKKLLFNTESHSNLVKDSHQDLSARCSEKISNVKNSTNSEFPRSSNIIEKLNNDRKNYIKNLDDGTNDLKEPSLSLKNESASSDSKKLCTKENLGFLVEESGDLNWKNDSKINNVSNNINKFSNSNYISNGHNSNNEIRKKINTDYSGSKNTIDSNHKRNIKQRESDNNNKENDKNLVNQDIYKRGNFNFSDLIPRKIKNHNYNRNQELPVNVYKQKNNNLSSIREEERSIDNNSSNKFLKSSGDSAKTISFGSENRNFVRKKSPTTSFFILSSSLKDN